ncbi:MAG: 3-deoxy-D-manno-octulosonic acid transferase [Candidatus Omnitrophica bacterium]|nr:3-deoxy-D-manno-octulosonic acid transferase [Candidatus Omnitrophota bacterium]
MSLLVNILYDIVCVLLSLFYIPYALFRKKLHRDLWRRLGYLPGTVVADRRKKIWIHSCSVGETKSIGTLFTLLKGAFPDRAFLISTITPTGNTVAREIAGEAATVFYLPIDLFVLTERVVRSIKPELFILVETELWPNLLGSLRRSGSRIIAVNGRISKKSFAGYRLVRFLFKRIFSYVDTFCVQSATDKERLKNLGVSESSIMMTGNMKFDMTLSLLSEDKRRLFQTLFPPAANRHIIVAASTHFPEEGQIMKVYKKLQEERPSLVLCIAPRHPERAADVARQGREMGLGPLFISRLKQDPAYYTEESDGPRVYILDSVGELMYLYEMASLVIIGGSFVPCGGHNPIEPGSLEKPVIVGPHMENFRDIFELFMQCGGIRQAQTIADLEMEIRHILGNALLKDSLGKNASRVVRANRGASYRIASFIGEKIG